VSSGKTARRRISNGFIEKKPLFHLYVHLYKSAYIFMTKKCMCAAPTKLPPGENTPFAAPPVSATILLPSWCTRSSAAVNRRTLARSVTLPTFLQSSTASLFLQRLLRPASGSPAPPLAAEQLFNCLPSEVTSAPSLPQDVSVH